MIRVKRETRESVKKTEEKRNLPLAILDNIVEIIGLGLILFFLFLLALMVKVAIR